MVRFATAAEQSIDISSSDPSAQVRQESGRPELSVVIPCLNEAETLEHVLRVANRALSESGIDGEIIVSDNGSSDGSIEIAQRCGARVVHATERGYGNALMAGISAARGTYVIMGDADASYDFAEIPKFLAKLREGNELVQGCRLPAGGGTVSPGAMPPLHRWIGNPFFSTLARFCFGSRIHDINCGLRGFSKRLYEKLDQRCTGMEFAVEMILKATLHREKIAEIPITLHQDGRKTRGPHLKTFRDGWRTLRFYMLSSPRWLFLYPGILFMCLGLLGYAVVLPALELGGITFDVHTLLVASLSVILGFQAVVFSVSAKVFAITEKLLPDDPRFGRLFRFFTLERGLIAGTVCAVVGLALIGHVFLEWRSVHYGALDSRVGLRYAIPGSLLVMLGIQTVFASFFLSILGLRRRN